ncbi:MAG: UDP-N-acetylglucosamine 2-epimerase (non-hydrolyzing) [Spirochaetales bacterium]|nr:UDP-N-acetylglucosamine 2-epimerase (non-hydrolyzing) [Spirochaetales bacterium]
MDTVKYKNIMIVFGTRPELIKMAPIIKKLEAYKKSLKTVVVSTGQHLEMIDKIIQLFKIHIDYDLKIMKPAQTLFDIVSVCIKKFKRLLETVRPDLVLVQGDTTTAFVAALSAYFYKIPVGHVEAGLRTDNKYSPFPEEINRKLITGIADIHFAPTKTSCRNLVRENVDRARILVTGNTVIDALLMVREKVRAETNIYKEFKGIDFEKKIILVTAHRRESFGKPFENMCAAIAELAERNPEIQFVYPVHLNPNVQSVVNKRLKNKPNIHLISPLDYNWFVFLMDMSFIVLTDSGGVQEEAPSLGKPVLVMRDTTERPECIKAGVAKLVGTDMKTIVKEVQQLLDHKTAYAKMSKKSNPYGDGKASDRIAGYLLGVKTKEF